MDFVQWTQILGNLGEFVASFGVLATLIYLAIEVRHSKAVLDKQSEQLTQSIQIAKATAETDLMSRNVDWYRSILENQSVAELVVKLNKNEALTEVEKEQARALLTQLLSLWGSSGFYYEKGLIGDELHETMMSGPRRALDARPGLIPVLAELRRTTLKAPPGRTTNNPLYQLTTMILAEYGYDEHGHERDQARSPSTTIDR